MAHACSPPRHSRAQDGNFACWDLVSNETFISRKHFAGKHKGAITCGAWGMSGQILALGSMNQLKVSKPLLNASWESTAAKLALPDNELSFQVASGRRRLPAPRRLPGMRP